VAIRDPREHLFEAAERVLLRSGPDALTSRAVTAEAGVAKGVLHKHFADFDDFLADLVRDRIRRIEAQAAGLLRVVGTGSVAANLAAALTELFGPVAVAMIGLLTFRDGLRARLRASGVVGVPVLAEGAEMVRAYLTAERDAGRLAPETDVDAIGLMIIGSGHLLFAGRAGDPPDPGDVGRVVAAALAGVLV
jgi:AcrR family transcriptional regulator